MRKITKLLQLAVIAVFMLGWQSAKSQGCNANFIFSYQANGGVSFTSTSIGTTSVTNYYWNFGPGTFTGMGASGANPFFTYTANGTYTVTLFLYSAAPSCSSAITQTISINNATGSGCNLNASWSNSLGGPGTMNFNNNTTGTISGVTYTWSYGDGNTSNGFNGTNTYSANGTYVVYLIANNNTTPSCIDTSAIQTVTITTVCNLVAGFNSSVGSNGNVSFVSTSTGTSAGTYYTWNFGDASPVSHATNPSHIYATGNYVASLTIANSSVAPSCTSSISHTISVTNTCVPNASFTLQPSNTPQLWFAIPANTTNIAAAQWSWGDGSTSNTLFTSHQYSAAGMYTICLSVTLTCGSSAMSCTSYSVYRSSSAIININVIAPGTVGLNEAQLLDEKISIYPNPNSGLFNVSLNGINNTAVIEVTNMLGQVIYKTEATSGVTNVGIPGIARGIYYVKVSEGKQTSVKKISVQ